ncbi:MAG: MFS transporter, partial [Leptospirillum sp.]
SLSQLSRPPEDPGTLLKIRHLAAEYTSNMIFFDLGLAGLLGAALTLLFFLFFRPATDPPDPSVSGV